MAWEDAAARLGTGALVAGLRALEGTMKKGQFKRLVATTAAEILAVHPDLKPKKARRWARRATGTRPWKKAKLGVKKAVETAAVAAVTAGAAKAATKVAKKPAVRRRLGAVRARSKEAGS
ncbi:MAG TPA: hypothetical protein VH700_16240 [Gemmatimonadales bacterium]|jgi:hypothetical protein